MLTERIDRDQFGILWRQIMSSLLKAAHSKAKLTEVIKAVEEDPAYKEIYEKWDGLTPEEMAEAWQKTNTLMTKAIYATRPYCVRCGDCCQESSPTLYEEDLALLMNGVLDKKDIMTLRKGEIGYSPKEGRTVILTEELIKVKEEGDEGPCIFYKDKGCGIYENRPRQCRTLECWNPESFEVFSSLTPLDRKAILPEDNPLWEVIAAHEKRCSHELLSSILEKGQELDHTSEDKALDIILYDLHVRMFMEETLGIKKEDMDFLFGRPALQTLSAYGYRLEGEEGQPTKIVKIKANESASA
ncbi:MAG: YkgJ family cysteine cluster protein [Desulfovibrionales bacterium]|nr:YkgJ family cysteine cluster protein [Desulfovibrionales bacterium]